MHCKWRKSKLKLRLAGEKVCGIYPCNGVFPLIDTFGFIFWARWLFLFQELHSVPLVLQLCLVALPEL